MIKTAKVDLSKVDVKKLESLLDKQCQTQLVAINDIVPNPFNKNSMGAQYFAALKAQLADSEVGFTAPIIVRRHPDQDSSARFQIVDGEHRWRAAREVGYSKVPVYEISATDAKTIFMMVAQNRIHGQTSEDDMMGLLNKIRNDFADDPFLSDEGQRDLFARMILEEDAAGDKSKYDISEDDLGQNQEITQPVTLYFTSEQIDLWRQIVGQIRLSSACTAESAAIQIVEHFRDTTGFGGPVGDSALDAKQADLLGDDEDIPQVQFKGKKSGRAARSASAHGSAG